MYQQMTTTIEKCSKRPLIQLKADREFWKCLVLSIITLGIYQIYLYDSISKDINIISEKNGFKKTVRYALICVAIFLPIMFFILIIGFAIAKECVYYQYIGNYEMVLGFAMLYIIFSIILSLVCNVILFIWFHKISNRIGNEIRRRGIDCEFSAKTFWLWFVLGSMIIVGPFVYMNKMVNNMNKLNENYNING